MNARNRKVRPALEALEDRQLLATLNIAADGLVTYTAGANIANRLTVVRTSMNGQQMYAFADGAEAINPTGNTGGVVRPNPSLVLVPVSSVSAMVTNLRDQGDRLDLLTTDHPITINAGTGNDVVVIGSSSNPDQSTMAGIRGPVSVDGGNDTSPADSLQLLDGNTGGSKDWFITRDSTFRSDSVSGVLVQYSRVQFLDVQAGRARDTIRVQSSNADMNINLRAGLGADIIRMGQNGSLAGLANLPHIDGQGGSDWLDYSQHTAGVSVDLFNRQASGVENGRLSSVENVLGGSGADSIDGDARQNILIGNGGNDFMRAGDARDLVIGGEGRDTVDGGAGEDIVIGDRSNWDANTNALQSIMNEWARTDLTYAQRTTSLRNSFSFRLNAQTVFTDGAADQLFGNTDRDWFHGSTGDQLPDIITNQEVVN